jgi:pSer/pThr/pTyr-binding forkhead associated (FHA) protein
MKLSLVVMTAGKAAGQAIPVPSPQFIIGRDPQCNLRPASAMISKRHCAVLVKNNQVFLRDFDSTNGTFLNETQVKGEVALKDGDVLKVGPLTFRVTIEGVPAPSKPTPPPQPKKSNIMNDDAAAMLLNIDDDDGVEVAPSTAETENSVPGGTTVMEIPAMPPTSAESHAAEAPAADANANKTKLAEAKPPEKKKSSTGAAQDAAKALLDKLAKGRRK